MRKALHPAPDPPPSSHPRPDAQPDAPPSAAAGAGGGARLELGEAFSWEDVREAYARFHAAALAGAPGSVGLYVYTPRDCGWGNRLIDLASAYQVARPAAHFCSPCALLCLPVACVDAAGVRGGGCTTEAVQSEKVPDGVCVCSAHRARAGPQLDGPCSPLAPRR
eukprot:185364-Rhodomonas_salina.1